MLKPEHYETVLAQSADGRLYLPVPFDPAVVWNTATTHLGGSIGSERFRGVMTDFDGARGIPLAPGVIRDFGYHAGQPVKVILVAEGPLRLDLAPDFAQALSADPAVAAFGDALAPFYRKAFLKWVDSTKARPDLRAARIAEVAAGLKAGRKALDR